MSEYAERDPMDLEPHYSRHVSAMTGEQLHSKADIAAELAWRDQQIAKLRTEVDTLNVMMVGYEKQRDELIRVSEERDALAATVASLFDFVTHGSESKESALARIDAILDNSDAAAILAARDARVKAEALRKASKAFNDPKSWFASVELRLMADAIEKEAGDGL